MARKNLKVSEIVHEELEVRKRRDESFDDVLKRELGIIPNTISDLVTYFPDPLANAAADLANTLKDDDYHTVVSEHDSHFALNYDSKDTGRTIMQLQFFYSNDECEQPSLKILHRNQRGELDHLISVIQPELERLEIQGEFIHPSHGGVIDFGGAFTWDDLVAELEQPLRAIQQTASNRWG